MGGGALGIALSRSLSLLELTFAGMTNVVRWILMLSSLSSHAVRLTSVKILCVVLVLESP